MVVLLQPAASSAATQTDLDTIVTDIDAEGNPHVIVDNGNVLTDE